jgi:hypothetical protein
LPVPPTVSGRLPELELMFAASSSNPLYHNGCKCQVASGKLSASAIRCSVLSY